MEVRKIDQDEIKAILDLNEDQFNDIKSKRIAPSKLQETFVAFANADGGDIFVGVEDKSEPGDRVAGFQEQEEANGILSTLLEETNPSVENLLVEFLETERNGLILHIGIPKSPKVHYTSSGDCCIRVNASKRKIKGERVTQLAYSKGAEPYERKALPDIDVDDITDSKYLADYMRRVTSHLQPEVFLRKQRLLTKKDGDRVPNVGCILLFDEVPQATLDTRCAVKIYRLRTTEKEYKREQLAEMPVTISGPVEAMSSS